MICSFNSTTETTSVEADALGKKKATIGLDQYVYYLVEP